MNISENLKKELVLLNIYAKTKEELLKKLVGYLAENGLIGDVEDVYQKLVSREKKISTGVGKGVAVPHLLTDEVKKPVILIGTLSSGVGFESVDGKPVKVVFLVLSPQGDVSLHLGLLSKIAKIACYENAIDEIAEADDPAEVIDLIERVEEKLI